MTHKFTVGEMVELTPSLLRAAALGRYEIMRLMPASDISSDSPRYRIKSDAERHERIVSESDLTLRSDGFSGSGAAHGLIALPAIEP